MPKSTGVLELEALREQGLTKRGSQQFALLEKQSQDARIAHDAAARDLEDRSSRKSEYIYSGAKEISPIDALYLDHHKWKKDSVKRDREALGIYDKTPEHLVGKKEGEALPRAKFTTSDGYEKRELTNGPIGDVAKAGEQVDSKCACAIM